MEKKNSELPKLRVPSELFEKMKEVVDKLNTNSEGVEFTLSSFRRIAYRHFIQELLSNGLQINYRVE